MLYQALYVAADQAPLSRDVIYQPDLARYVADWGRVGDRGFVAIAPTTGQSIGAVWLRLLIGENKFPSASRRIIRRCFCISGLDSQSSRKITAHLPSTAPQSRS
jgi:hypothetical protein